MFDDVNCRRQRSEVTSPGLLWNRAARYQNGTAPSDIYLSDINAGQIHTCHIDAGEVNLMEESTP
ncbi:MAG: hypothetical protein ABI255_11565 [Microbacteriaceae bacterium]